MATHVPPGPPPARLALPDLAATEALGARLAARAGPGDALLLEGPLGAGKSALARAFLRAACRDPALEVPSPTFTLVQSYPLPGGGTAHHLDLWRLDGPGNLARDLAELGWDEARADLVLVEWPERLGPHRPVGPEVLTVTLAPVPDRDGARAATLAGWPGRALA